MNKQIEEYIYNKLSINGKVSEDFKKVFNRAFDLSQEIISEYNIITAAKSIRLSDIVSKLKVLMEKYNINDLANLEVALNYYDHIFDNVQTKMIDKKEMYIHLSDKLGCPLDVIFRAIENGITIIGTADENGDENGNMILWRTNRPLIALKEKRSFEEPRLIKYDDWCFSCESGSYSGCVALKDYKKTWWLKKMEVNRR